MKKESTLTPGESPTVFGDYELLRRLGIGGMAEVFLARPEGAVGDDLLVVKRLLPHISHQPELVQMFLDEARVATTLDHENIVKIHNVGVVGDQYFLSMEYLKGMDLTKLCSRLWRASRTVPLQLSLYVTWSVARALAHAYERRGAGGQPLRLVHRDVSPHNIFVTDKGGVKLLDFGVAKANNALHHTKTGAVVGKTGYMSPEQCRSESLDCRSDFFSLGIVLFELVTGGRLYSIKKLGDLGVLQEICSGQVPRPSESARGECPKQVDDFVMRLLAKEPAERPAHAQELVEELESCARSLSFELAPDAMEAFLRKEFSDVLDEEARRVRTFTGSYRIAVGSGAGRSKSQQFASGSAIERDEAEFPEEERTAKRERSSTGSSQKIRPLTQERPIAPSPPTPVPVSGVAVVHQSRVGEQRDQLSGDRKKLAFLLLAASLSLLVIGTVLLVKVL